MGRSERAVECDTWCQWPAIQDCAAERQSLIDNDLWTITGDSLGANTATIFTDLDDTAIFVEGWPVILDTDATITDSELDTLNDGEGNYDGATLTIVRNGGANSEDVLSFNDGNGITLSGGNLIKNSQVIATFDTTSTTGQVVLTFTDANGEISTSADVDNILQQIAYSNSASRLAGTIQLDWTFDDGNTGDQGSGGALQATGSTTVTLIDANDLFVATTTDSNDAGVVDGNSSHTVAYLNANKGADGFISLREAIIAASSPTNASAADEIQFDIAFNDAGHLYYQDDEVSDQVSIANIATTTATDVNLIGDIDPDWDHCWWRISNSMALPNVTEAVVIDGLSQSGASINPDRTPVIELDGSSAGVDACGFHVTNHSGSDICGFVINGFSDHGIRLHGVSASTFSTNNLGTDISGTIAVANGHGMQLYQGSNNVIGTDGDGNDDANEFNVVSGNTGQGIRVLTTSANNIIAGNGIGLDAAGSADLGNGSYGILIDGGSNGNRIRTDSNGTSDSAEANIISGNQNSGVFVTGNSTNTLIAGNYIGTDITGATALTNQGSGIYFIGRSGHTVGGPNLVARNIISGYTGSGIDLSGIDTTAIQGDYIGVNTSGTAAHANTVNGISLAGSVDNDQIGGTAAGEGNVISGNSVRGINFHTNSNGNTVQGNYIGTNAAGDAAVGNAVGILAGYSSNTVIGGTAAGAGNVISGNSDSEAWFYAASATGNLLQGNIIGLNATETAAVGNANYGVKSSFGAGNNTAGGTATGAGNTIAGNRIGVGVEDTASGLTVRGYTFETTPNWELILGESVLPPMTPGMATPGPTTSKISQ